MFSFRSPKNFYSCDLFWFYDYLNSWLFGILVFVFLSFLFLFYNCYYFKVLGRDYRKIEFISVIIPIFILFFSMVPSLHLLYLSSYLDVSPELTVKVIGHQWYWEYEVSDISDLVFDSYMNNVEDLSLGDLRLLEVDNRLVLPVGLNIRFCVTSADVIHSWSVSSLSVKLDAVPGVLNVVTVHIPIVGLFYGQCSEICGANHSFMPICIEVTTWEGFYHYLTSYYFP